jgi:hypothetical protein
MTFNFLAGDGEHQVKERPFVCGDLFSYLGTPKTQRYLVLSSVEHFLLHGTAKTPSHYIVNL